MVIVFNDILSSGRRSGFRHVVIERECEDLLDKDSSLPRSKDFPEIGQAPVFKHVQLISTTYCCMRISMGGGRPRKALRGNKQLQHEGRCRRGQRKPRLKQHWLHYYLAATGVGTCHLAFLGP
jgi:hypothetical protein